jgi:hypothetical protein
MSEIAITIPEEQRQAILDQEHLKLLSIGFLVSGCLHAAFSLFGLLYVAMGVLMHGAFANIQATAKNPSQAPPPEIAWFMAIFGSGIFLVMITLAALKLRTAWCLKRRRSRTFCLITSGISCLGIPYGTLLGVFSFMVLGRPSVKALFDAPQVP